MFYFGSTVAMLPDPQIDSLWRYHPSISLPYVSPGGGHCYHRPQPIRALLHHQAASLLPTGPSPPGFDSVTGPCRAYPMPSMFATLLNTNVPQRHMLTALPPCHHYTGTTETCAHYENPHKHDPHYPHYPNDLPAFLTTTCRLRRCALTTETTSALLTLPPTPASP